MPVDYDPKDAVMCWKEGDYVAVLQTVEDKTSKVKPDGSGGNPMQVWTWEVFNSAGQTQLIADYVVIPAATWKIKQLAKALGKEDQFKAGKFQADNNIGCTVMAELIVESQQGYDDKNKIGKLKMKEPGNSSKPPPAQRTSMKPQPSGVGAEVLGGEQQFKDDDIPF